MPRRVMEGRVVSDKTNKTITVLIERRIMDPLYKKFIRRTKKYTAHDEANAFRVGDAVKIEECSPISKTKRWKVISDVPAEKREMKPVETAMIAKAAAMAAKPAAKKVAKAAAPKPAAKAVPAKVAATPVVEAKAAPAAKAPKAAAAKAVAKPAAKAADKAPKATKAKTAKEKE